MVAADREKYVITLALTCVLSPRRGFLPGTRFDLSSVCLTNPALGSMMFFSAFALICLDEA